MITTRDKILSAVMKPTRYTGGELNSVIKNPADVDVRFGFCFADTYEIAMSHLGLKILYHTLNDREDTYCERVFAPWTDMEEEMKKQESEYDKMIKELNNNPTNTNKDGAKVGDE